MIWSSRQISLLGWGKKKPKEAEFIFHGNNLGKVQSLSAPLALAYWAGARSSLPGLTAQMLFQMSCNTCRLLAVLQAMQTKEIIMIHMS